MTNPKVKQVAYEDRYGDRTRVKLLDVRRWVALAQEGDLASAWRTIL